jgi:hypothetical protein
MFILLLAQLSKVMLISTLKYIDQEFYKKEIILKLRLYSDFIHFKLQYNFYYLNK